MEQGRPRDAQVDVHDSWKAVPIVHATPAAVKVAERVEVAEDVDVPEPVAEDVDDAEAVAVPVAVDDAVMVAVTAKRGARAEVVKAMLPHTTPRIFHASHDDVLVRRLAPQSAAHAGAPTPQGHTR